MEITSSGLTFDTLHSPDEFRQVIEQETEGSGAQANMFIENI